MPITYVTFCNLRIEIEGINQEYNSMFLNTSETKNGDNDCLIHVKRVRDIQTEDQSCLFESFQGIHVYKNDSFETRVFHNPFTMEKYAKLVDYGNHKELQILENKEFSEMELGNCLGLEKTMYEHGRFILHSSFIQTEKGVILFTAPSGTGKSTQADLWRQYRGIEIINGDRSGIWKENDKWMAGGVPWCGTSGIMKNKIMPLRAIVVLKQGPVNEIQKVSFPYKVARILEQITVNPWNEEMIKRAKMFSMLLCQEIPVVQLSCLPDLGAVEVLEKELEKY